MSFKQKVGQKKIKKVNAVNTKVHAKWPVSAKVAVSLLSVLLATAIALAVAFGVTNAKNSAKFDADMQSGQITVSEEEGQVGVEEENGTGAVEEQPGAETEPEQKQNKDDMSTEEDFVSPAATNIGGGKGLDSKVGPADVVKEEGLEPDTATPTDATVGEKEEEQVEIVKPVEPEDFFAK